MNKLFQLLYAPETESSGSGGAAVIDSGPKIDRSSDAAIADLFGKSEPEVEVTETKPVTKPAAKPAAAAPAKDAAKKGSILESFEAPAEDAVEDVEEPAKEEPKAEELPEDKVQLGKYAKPDTTKAFETLRTVTKSVRTELATAQARIAELEKGTSAAPAAAPVDEKLKADYQSALDRLAVLDLESHPDFKRQFAEPKAQLAANIEDALKANAVDGVDVSSLLGKSRADFGKAVNEIAAKLGDFDRAAFVNDMRSLYDLQGKSKAALANSSELRGQLTAKAQAAQRAAFSEVGKALGDSDGVLSPYAIPEGADEEGRKTLESYNASASNVSKEAEKIMFSANTDKGLATVSYEAAMFRHLKAHGLPAIQNQYRALREILTATTNELKALKGMKRSAGSPASGASNEPNAAKQLHEMGAEEATRTLFKRR